MALTKYNYKQEHSVFHAILEGYKQAGNEHWGVTGAAGGFGQYIKDNKLRTAIVGGTFLAISLTAACFMSPAYMAFVGTVVTKAATLVSPAITAVSAFLVAHPLVASLIVVAAVAALIAAPVYACMNNSKASQIDEMKQKIVDACEKETNGKPKVDDGKLKFDNAKVNSTLESICDIFKFTPAEAKSRG